MMKVKHIENILPGDAHRRGFEYQKKGCVLRVGFSGSNPSEMIDINAKVKERDTVYDVSIDVVYYEDDTTTLFLLQVTALVL